MVICTLIFLTGGVNAQELKKVEEVMIQTSAKCGDCEVRIEDALNYMKGVKFAELNNDTKVVTVRYKTKTVSLDEIKEKIASVGYDADDVKAKEEGIAKLPACCKPTMEKH